MAYRTFEESKRLQNELDQYRVYCKCGHSIYIYPFEHINKKLCTHCNNFVYVNDREEFKDKLRKEMKK